MWAEYKKKQQIKNDYFFLFRFYIGEKTESWKKKKYFRAKGWIISFIKCWNVTWKLFNFSTCSFPNLFWSGFSFSLIAKTLPQLLVIIANLRLFFFFFLLLSDFSVSFLFSLRINQTWCVAGLVFISPQFFHFLGSSNHLNTRPYTRFRLFPFFVNSLYVP